MRITLALPLLSFVVVSCLSLGVGTGCSLLVGNVKPVDEKSDSYGVADLSRESPDRWQRLSATAEGVDAKDPAISVAEVPDVAFQSKATSSIISLNSACRSGGETEERDLKGFTNLLFLGISDVSFREESELKLQRGPALETTIQGKLNGEPMKLRTVVLRRGDCLYDLMYVARPDQFPANETDFSHFIASLRLR
jgi:hypothetical protein